jgi:hypothetical protein
MKIRQGFVSNSSSSSFIIVSKRDKLSEKMLSNAFGLDKNHILSPIVKGLCNYIFHNAEITNTKKILEDYYVEDIKDLSESYQQAIKSNGNIYECSVSTDGEDIERVLIDLEINYEDDDLIITKEAGY